MFGESFGEIGALDWNRTSDLWLRRGLKGFFVSMAYTLTL